MTKNISFDHQYQPAAPVIHFRLGSPGGSPYSENLIGLIDTGSDGTIIPYRYLELAEAVGVGDAILHSLFEETREVFLFEVDFYINDIALPGILVISDEQRDEIIIGRNVLNKLVLLINGPKNTVTIME